MRGWLASGLLLVTVIAVAVVGLLDAVFIEEHDFAALFALDAAMAAAALVLWGASRRAVRVEPDLARWLRMRAELTGEHVDRIADRALTGYRRELEGQPAGTDPAPGP